MNQERCGTTPALFGDLLTLGLADTGTCQAQGLPKGHNSSCKTLLLLPLSTSASKILPRTRRRVMPKSKMQLPPWPEKMSQFHGKRPEKSAKEITFFYLVGKENFRSPAPPYYTQTPFQKCLTETPER